MTEPKVVRRNPRFGSALSQSEWDKIYNLSDPDWHAPIVEHIPTDNRDKWVAVALGIAVLIVIGLDSAWFMGWLICHLP